MEDFQCESCDNVQKIIGSKTILIGRAGSRITLVCDVCGHYNEV